MIDNWTDAYENFDDYVNEVTNDGEVITIMGLDFEPATILYDTDPVAYRCMFNDWADAMDIDADDLSGYPERH